MKELIQEERSRSAGRICVAQHEAAELREKLEQKEAEIEQHRGAIAACDTMLAQIDAAQKAAVQKPKPTRN